MPYEDPKRRRVLSPDQKAAAALRSKRWQLSNREHIKAYRAKRRARINAQKRASYRRNRVANREQHRKWASTNREHLRQYHAEYRLRNKDRLRRKKTQAKRLKWNTNPMYRLKELCRHRLYLFLKTRHKNTKRTIELIGCSWPELQRHIENQFTGKMSWEKLMRSEIHIDHRVPLARGNTPAEIERLCHYTNLQPLWATTKLARDNGDMVSIGNFEKNAKYEQN